MTRGMLSKVVVLCAVLALKAMEAKPASPLGLSNCFLLQVTRDADPSQIGRGGVQRTNGKQGHIYTNVVRGFPVQLPLGLAKQVIEIQTGVLLVEPDVPVCAAAQTLPTGVNSGDFL